LLVTSRLKVARQLRFSHIFICATNADATEIGNVDWSAEGKDDFIKFASIIHRLLTRLEQNSAVHALLSSRVRSAITMTPMDHWNIYIVLCLLLSVLLWSLPCREETNRRTDHKHLHCVSKNIPMFLAITRESIVRFS